MEKCRDFQFIYTPLIIILGPGATDPISYHDGCTSPSSKVLAKGRALNKATMRVKICDSKLNATVLKDDLVFSKIAAAATEVDMGSLGVLSCLKTRIDIQATKAVMCMFLLR